MQGSGGERARRRYRFEGFLLDVAQRELWFGDQAVHLSARQFELLAALVERGGEVVRKNELLSRVWPRRVVEENNVAVQVFGLRRVLGPAAIETMTGRGYRFAWPVERDLAPAPEALAVAAAAAPSPHRAQLCYVRVEAATGLDSPLLALVCVQGCSRQIFDGGIRAGLLRGAATPQDQQRLRCAWSCRAAGAAPPATPQICSLYPTP